VCPELCWGRHEELDGVQERFQVLHDIFAEGKGLNSTVTSICLSLRRCHLKSKLVSAMEIEDLEMLDFCICEQDRVVAYGLFWLSCGDKNIEFGLVNRFILEGYLFEASSLKRSLWVGRADL